MNRTTRLVPTLHAIERYLERFAPTASHEQARHALVSLASKARRLKIKVVCK